MTVIVGDVEQWTAVVGVPLAVIAVVLLALCDLRRERGRIGRLVVGATVVALLGFAAVILVRFEGLAV